MRKQATLYVSLLLLMCLLLGFLYLKFSTGDTDSESFEPDIEILHSAELVEDICVTIGGTEYTSVLSDDNIYTKRYLMIHGEIVVESEESFAALYITWDDIPGDYKLVWDTGEIECGRYGFLHEYVRLPESVNRVWFEFPCEMQRVLCDIEIYTEGGTPDGAQEWLPPCEAADILVFPVHSDDEALFFGPLITYYAVERELTIQTAFMVDHGMKTYRDHERLNGLWALGVRNYPVLGHAPDNGTHSFDSAMPFYKPYDVDMWHMEQVRRFRPLVVVGHDFDGEYGNAGHKVSAFYLTQVIEAAGDGLQYPDSAEKYGIWNKPKYYVHLYEENAIVLDVDTPMTNDPTGRSPFEAASDALKNYVSQLEYFPYIRKGPKYPEYDCTLFGLYRSLVGMDTGSDIMENIDIEYWRELQAAQ